MLTHCSPRCGNPRFTCLWTPTPGGCLSGGGGMPCPSLSSSDSTVGLHRTELGLRGVKLSSIRIWSQYGHNPEPSALLPEPLSSPNPCCSLSQPFPHLTRADCPMAAVGSGRETSGARGPPHSLVPPNSRFNTWHRGSTQWTGPVSM